MVGIVFLSEGIKKILFANTLGVGRFEKNRVAIARTSSDLVKYYPARIDKSMFTTIDGIDTLI
jgi:hypothetical protein